MSFYDIKYKYENNEITQGQLVILLAQHLKLNADDAQGIATTIIKGCRNYQRANNF